MRVGGGVCVGGKRSRAYCEVGPWRNLGTNNGGTGTEVVNWSGFCRGYWALSLGSRLVEQWRLLGCLAWFCLVLGWRLVGEWSSYRRRGEEQLGAAGMGIGLCGDLRLGVRCRGINSVCLNRGREMKRWRVYELECCSRSGGYDDAVVVSKSSEVLLSDCVGDLT